jgi:hypothetical protein
MKRFSTPGTATVALRLSTVFTTLLLLAACGGGGNRVYRDSSSGLQFDYPTEFTARSFLVTPAMLSTNGGFRRGAIVVNDAGRAILSNGSANSNGFLWSDPGPNATTSNLQNGSFVWADLAANAIAFVFEGGTIGETSPPRNATNANLPLRALRFRSLKGEKFTNSAYWHELRFLGCWLAVFVGPRASEADRATIWRVVASLRFSRA